MALLTALFATVLLMALGLSVLLLGSAETTLAAHDRDARALAAASRAAVTIAIADLRALPEWDGLSAPGPIPEVSATPGPFVDGTLAPAAPWGGPALDLRALTVRLQADSDAATPPGGAAPVWRLYEYGPLVRLIPDAGARNPYYLVVWVADDAGVVVARGVAYGPDEARSITEVTVAGAAELDPVRILTIRPGA
jgi:hypothetical protein